LDWNIELLKYVGRYSDFTAAQDLDVELGSLRKVKWMLDCVDFLSLIIESF